MNNRIIKLAFICVENAGRSQMAAAFAEKEKEKREMNVEITMGGTEPAEKVHYKVVKVMKERGIDIEDNKPRKITQNDVQSSDYAITMGCSAESVCPISWNGVSRDWNLDDPGKVKIERVREIRDKIEEKVKNLLDEIEKRYR